MTDNQYSVDLERGRGGLGFSVESGGDRHPKDHPTDKVLCIKKVFAIGPAADSRKIRQGDVILEVNGRSVKGLTLPVSVPQWSSVY